jgi:hypothetical protein
MIPISFDITDIIDSFSLKEEEINVVKKAVVTELTSVVYDAWRENAFEELGSTAESYSNGLIVVDEGRFINDIILTGQFNNMIEFGVGPFDMKEGFSKSSKRELSANGNWYLTIPFKWSTPNTEGSNKMPSDIYKTVKRDGSITEKNIPKGYKTQERVKLINNELNKVFETYKHKTSIYMGIQKDTAVYEKSTQSTYSSFRRVGEMSDPNSWIHPGLSQRNLAQKTLDSLDIQEITNNIVNEQLINLGF